jgi:hypothetical protein
MKTETIRIYKFDELSWDAKENVVYWLNTEQEPIEYENDEGCGCLYYDELDDAEIADHCEINGYEFLEDGTIY